MSRQGHLYVLDDEIGAKLRSYPHMHFWRQTHYGLADYDWRFGL